ncbi:YeeE/YedE family protein [Pannonibacter sp. SL95]|jgi:hypothetical protein|uniref:YeeE/YedE family protein n=1 Tax=Pannonibacter sp. SL95 TaxID=2995153 RepID=UPI002274F1A1|nr:YeeE/YedE family protein [Pannonibacter sp. SL95]MCY1706930.1 YeeE/YedE family protein [Pannonibacter sp. SL95]
MRFVSALVIGLVFGLGIMLSGMANPAKVLNFFDIAGTWDPSLAFVMGGALVVTAIGYRLVFRSAQPMFAPRFLVPTRKDIDVKLVGGSAVFGIGWGLSGFCPGGLVPALGIGDSAPWIAFAAIVAGMMAARVLSSLQARQKLAPGE